MCEKTNTSNTKDMSDFLILHRVEMGVLILIASVIINLLLKLKWTKNFIESVVDDTLKVDDGKGKRRFSGTKITMFVAFGSVVWSFHYITVRHGFNETAFITMAAIATGVGISKALSKKLDPEVTTPDTQITIKEETSVGSKETSIKEESA